MRVVLEKNDIVSYESSFDAFSVFHAGSINRTVRASIPVPEFADPNVHTIYTFPHNKLARFIRNVRRIFIWIIMCPSSRLCIFADRVDAFMCVRYAHRSNVNIRRKMNECLNCLQSKYVKIPKSKI